MKNFVFIALVLFAGPSYGQVSYNVQLLSHWQNTSLPASTQHLNTYNEVWGFARDGREYAVIGSTMGTHIIDVTEPTVPVEAAFVPGAAQGPIVVHRHFHDYAGYLYGVCDEGASTLQVIDLHFLPDSAPVRYSSNSIFTRAHNFYIDTISARMYLAGGDLFHAVISLADPINPVLIKHSLTQIPFWNQIGYVHDNYARNDTVYLNAGFNGLFVVDFSDIDNPQMIGSLTDYPYKGYNHSGWLSDDGNRYIMADENFGYRMKMLNVSNLQNISVEELIWSGVHQFSIPHNPLINGDKLYVAYYNDGLYIWDISQEGNAQVVGWYDTSTSPHVDGAFRGAWGTYPYLPSGIILVADMQNGLFVLDASAAVGTADKLPTQSSMVRVHTDVHGYPFRVSCPDGSKVFSVEARDLAGKSVAYFNSGEIDLAGLPKAIYGLIINTERGLRYTKTYR